MSQTKAQETMHWRERIFGVLQWREAAHKLSLQDLACYLSELVYYIKLGAPDNRNDLRHTHAPRQH